jgi:hypothetical protein
MAAAVAVMRYVGLSSSGSSQAMVACAPAQWSEGMARLHEGDKIARGMCRGGQALQQLAGDKLTGQAWQRLDSRW